MEGDINDATAKALQRKFQSTPSAWRETQIRGHEPERCYISIHSLRMEGDDFVDHVSQKAEISIHSLRMEGDHKAPEKYPPAWTFQSTPSAWRETFTGMKMNAATAFQSTPSAWRETCRSGISRQTVRHFNPLPPHGGRPPAERKPNARERNFNPLPPHGGRRFLSGLVCQTCCISIHSLRMEGDAA